MIKHRSVSTLQAKLESVDAAIASHPISSENVQSAHAIIEAIGKDNKELVERTRGTRPARTRRTWETAAARDRELVEAPKRAVQGREEDREAHEEEQAWSTRTRKSCRAC